MVNEHLKSGALNLLDAPFARVKSENNYFNQDRLDMVISSHKLPVERFPDNFESSPGNCWYSSIAEVINKEVEEGRMSIAELKIDKEKPLTHEDVRAAVTKFMESDDCIMADYWIEQHFGGSQER